MACTERYGVVDEVFRRLDTRNAGFLGSGELRVFADATGFDGDDDFWTAMFNEIAEGFRLTEEGMNRVDFAQFAREFIHDDEEEFLDLFPLEKDAYQIVASSTRAPSLSSMAEKEQAEEVQEFDLVSVAGDISPCRQSSGMQNAPIPCAADTPNDVVSGLNPHASVFVPGCPEESQRALKAAWRRGGFKALYHEGFIYDPYYDSTCYSAVPHQVTTESASEKMLAANFSGNLAEFQL